MDPTNFANAVASARSGTFSRGGVRTRRIVDVSAIPGADELPACLVVLLENVVRRAQTDEQAVLAASRIIDASRKGSAGEEIEFMPRARPVPGLHGVPVFVDFARCVTPWWSAGETRASLTLEFPARSSSTTL